MLIVQQVHLDLGTQNHVPKKLLSVTQKLVAVIYFVLVKQLLSLVQKAELLAYNQ